jgi:hypothetical protein
MNIISSMVLPKLCGPLSQLTKMKMADLDMALSQIFAYGNFGGTAIRNGRFHPHLASHHPKRHPLSAEQLQPHCVNREWNTNF